MELGIKVRDRITGFGGIVTCHAIYLSGCNQALVVPPIDEKGAYRDSQWFDVQRLEVLDATPVQLDNSQTPGFDKEAPKR